MLDRLKCQAYSLPMPAAQTPAKIEDLTCSEMIKPSYIENGRRKWESISAGSLIRMFAANGCDVTKQVHPDTGKEISGCWDVRDQSGVDVAYIMSHRDVQKYAFASTYKNW